VLNKKFNKKFNTKLNTSSILAAMLWRSCGDVVAKLWRSCGDPILVAMSYTSGDLLLHRINAQFREAYLQPLVVSAVALAALAVVVVAAVPVVVVGTVLALLQLPLRASMIPRLDAGFSAQMFQWRPVALPSV
jgi:hypothetical protein